MTYDLLEQPWLPVRRVDGSMDQVGLRAALRDAHDIESLVGDIGSQEAALLRLLLAVALSAYREQLLLDDEDGWAALWDAPMLPEEHLLAYLEEHRERFDLLDAQAPFLQTPGLRTAGDTNKGVVTLLPDVRNNERLFSTRAGRGLDALPTAEAARWLVACHAFDPSGIKSGAVDDPRVKGGRGYPIGTGWAGQLGLVLVQGRTLRETLLLNLARPAAWREDDVPVWERSPLTGAAQDRSPTGPVDLYTWASRRIRLVGDAERITAVLICNGDPLSPQDRHDVEPMSGWRNSKNQAKQLGRPRVYMPRSHDPDRAMWRGLGSLLEHRNVGEEKETVPSLTLAWLGQLRENGLLSAAQPLVLRTIGMTYGPQSAVEATLVDEALPLPAVLLGSAGRGARVVALDAVQRADTVGLAVGNLARNLAQAAGGDGEGERAAARAQFFFALETPYARWLNSLAGVGPDELDGAETAWQVIVGRQARTQGGQLLESAGPASWTGRDVGPRDRQTHVNAFLADLWFRTAVAKALPDLAPAAPSPTHQEPV